MQSKNCVVSRLYHCNKASVHCYFLSDITMSLVNDAFVYVCSIRKIINCSTKHVRDYMNKIFKEISNLSIFKLFS